MERIDADARVLAIGVPVRADGQDIPVGTVQLDKGDTDLLPPELPLQAASS
jgi:hypothetical protein